MTAVTCQRRTVYMVVPKQRDHVSSPWVCALLDEVAGTHAAILKFLYGTLSLDEAVSQGAVGLLSVGDERSFAHSRDGVEVLIRPQTAVSFELWVTGLLPDSRFARQAGFSDGENWQNPPLGRDFRSDDEFPRDVPSGAGD